MSRRAVFLDKDGTLIEDVPYNVDPRLIRLGRGAPEGLPLLHRAGFRLIVISNQSGIARGRFAEEALEAVRERLRQLLGDLGVPLAGFYYCPHHPEGHVPRFAIACSCRKPEPGLIFSAAREHGVDLNRSWFVGDILDDVEAGRRAGCRTVLLDNGHETEWRSSPLRQPDVVASDLAEASRIIAAGDRRPSVLETRESRPGLNATTGESAVGWSSRGHLPREGSET
jgi:D-glycero-D-manno-heptose 1,7-bisphosphate phosphatase